ncbi:MAG: hypothetical protein ACI9DF_005106 [Verrucomicrobiales bacterium]|jgi:hypothetical protein
MSTWAILIKRVYEVAPLECPCCGGQMKIERCQEIQAQWPEEQRERRRALQAEEKRDQSVAFTIPEIKFGSR